ncbi:hypothetical protein [Actinophytocola sp.]|uniref:hypothetical protein n=1 Tax=Actinophytocola sp. TaxID=1872138 RepID=UPI003D6ACC05
MGEPDHRRLHALESSVQAANAIGVPEEQPHYAAEYIASPDPGTVAAGIADTVQTSGASAVNVKFYYPGVSDRQMREQLVAFGQQVLPELRGTLAQVVPTRPGARSVT